jgi:hypothetical protein
MQTKQKEKEINNFLPPHQKRCAIVVPFDGTATATLKQHKWPQKDHALRTTRFSKNGASGLATQNNACNNFK